MAEASATAARPAKGLAAISARFSSRTVGWIKAAAFLLSFLPLARLVAGIFMRSLGTNPTEFILRSLGDWTLNFLFITLAVTPLRRISGWNWLLRFRRMLGLFAFFYALLHFTTYVVLDQGLDAAAIVRDIVKRPFITLGFLCLVFLIPLAITSTNAMVKRLGAKRWQTLHRLVYFIAIGGVIHYWWLVKRDITLPAVYALVLSVLLGYRLITRATARRSAAGK